MSSEWERGFQAGWNQALDRYRPAMDFHDPEDIEDERLSFRESITSSRKVKKKRKLSAWQKFVKVNSKKPRFRYKSGAKKGKINLKALGVAYRKTPAGKKKRR